MPDLNELIAQRAALDQQIAQARRDARAQAIAQVKALMVEHGLTQADLVTKRGKPGKARTAGSKVAAKYRNKVTGETWSGRGLQPRWLKAALAGGKKLADFAV
ncbi:MAG TPA: H-NS histone family protein [Burkholderiaceae bacterium]|nr:H-NS histone family protein [Burkholderiaceae bacterium]